MVTAKESQTCQQFSAWNPPDLDHMSRFQLERNHSLQGFPPTTFTTNVALQGKWTSNLRSLDLVQRNAVTDSVKLPPPNGNIPRPTGCPYANHSQFALPLLLHQQGNSLCPDGFRYVKDSQNPLTHNLRVSDMPVDASATPQKRFLIFDKSGSQTRLFCSPLTPENRITQPKILSTANGYCEQFATLVDNRKILVKSTLEEKCDENDLVDGEGEMSEDSDEINALLYSDSDDEFNDDNIEDDEVTSTGHTPLIIQEGYIKNKLLDKLTEEVASSDELPKRQRLIDGRYMKSSVASFDSSTKKAGYEDDTESSCAGARSYSDDIDSSKREKKVKIRNALKIIASLIPGYKDNDPISIIDKAIAYLKTMKTEAEALGLSSPKSELTSFSQ